MHFIANIAIGGSAAAAVLKLLEWALSDAQKHALSAQSVRWWNWLDDTSRRRLMVSFEKGRPRLFLSIASLLITAGILVDSFVRYGNDPGAKVSPLTSILSSCIAFMFALWVLPKLLRWLSRSNSTVEYWLRLLGLTLLACATVAGVMVVGRTVGTSLPEITWVVTWLFYPPLVAASTILLLSALTLTATFYLYMAKALISVLEFLMRRIAESPKGPLLAASALVGGIATVAKVFQ